MRNIVFALTGLVMLSATPALAWMPGDSPYDPGCNIHQGGNCGKQLDMQNNTWRRLHLPLEPGRGASGTYLPSGGYIPNGRGNYYGGQVVGRPTYGYGNAGDQQFGDIPGAVRRTFFAIIHREGRRFSVGAGPKLRSNTQTMRGGPPPVEQTQLVPTHVAVEVHPLSSADTQLLNSLYK